MSTAVALTALGLLGGLVLVLVGLWLVLWFLRRICRQGGVISLRLSAKLGRWVDWSFDFAHESASDESPTIKATLDSHAARPLNLSQDPNREFSRPAVDAHGSE